jgi:hypothetical protein
VCSAPLQSSDARAYRQALGCAADEAYFVKKLRLGKTTPVGRQKRARINADPLTVWATQQIARPHGIRDALLPMI